MIKKPNRGYCRGAGRGYRQPAVGMAGAQRRAIGYVRQTTDLPWSLAGRYAVSLSSPGTAICDSDLSVLSSDHPRWRTYPNQAPANWEVITATSKSRVELSIDDSRLTNSSPRKGDPTPSETDRILTMHLPITEGSRIRLFFVPVRGQVETQFQGGCNPRPKREHLEPRPSTRHFRQSARAHRGEWRLQPSCRGRHHLRSRLCRGFSSVQKTM